ncbi:uroporphyrinogen III synthase HEM4 [Sphingomonas oleivorans]|uniref:Uroporphyrinogen III synthase HEM4 n=1 Tax=Sphingomonas oleivorans TaxID=1735121 RepID=A0A2T5G2L3_9SPHN|nr:uroporphyrinogen-III synthase [Sphingomonas oleivorans]PTQ13393.1 uroporphyrinogen III synthase HEM4 [Sphingomonas oleivorans]
MRRRLLLLRPEPGASATAERAGQAGWKVIRAPLFHVEPLGWDAVDPAEHDAVMMTSANAARHGGTGLERLVGLPLYAVGAVTAKAAQAAGFADVRTGEADGAALIARAARDGIGRLLHLAGEDHRSLAAEGVRIARRIVYRARAVERLPAEAHVEHVVALLHSPRAAALFGALVDQAGIKRGGIAVAAISPAASEAAGMGWAGIVAAERPTDAALLAAAARLCDQGPISGEW